MSDRIAERVYDHDHIRLLHLDETKAGVEIVFGHLDPNYSGEPSLTLDLDGVRKLRLALARYERKHRR